MSSTREQLLREIESFILAHDMPVTTFGKQAVGDPAFVGRLRDGRDPHSSTVDRVRAFIRGGYRKPRPKRSPVRALVTA